MFIKKYPNGTFDVSDTFIDGFEECDPEEIANIYAKNDPVSIPSAPILDPLSVQNAKIKALSDRNDFLEDCIAEMAQIIYSE